MFNAYKAQKTQNKQMEDINKNKKYIKKHEKSYEDIISHVLVTPESKEQCVAQVVGNIAKKKVNINVKKNKKNLCYYIYIWKLQPQQLKMSWLTLLIIN